MKIFLIGYGKMGKIIEAKAKEAGFVVSDIVDAGQFWPHLDAANLPDVAIEFTSPDAVVDNLKHCLEIGIPVVTGTTGWNNRMTEVEALCKKKGGGIVYASNFSIGVNLWFHLVKMAAEGFGRFPEYSAGMDEVHHVTKADKPSGTAITAAGIILDHMNKYDDWSLKEEKNKLHIEAHRRQDVTGIHSVRFTSAMDEIELVHRASNREGFAAGALKAAEWLTGRKGFYNFADIFHEIFNLSNK